MVSRATSPYLFVLVMTALLHDVHWQAQKRVDYPNGVDFGEVLYAGDTILIGKDPEEVQKVLQKIEVSKECGLSLNKDKCVHLRISSNSRVELKDKQRCPTKTTPHIGEHN